jgi:hypothetical protein
VIFSRGVGGLMVRGRGGCDGLSLSGENMLGKLDRPWGGVTRG